MGQVYPEGDDRGHGDYLANKEVHVSLLTSRPAYETARIILGEYGRQDDQRPRAFYAFRGDTLSAGMTQDVAKWGWRELQVEKPIARGWVRKGSLDGFAIVYSRSFVVECKAHAFPVKGTHDEAAWRQAMLYLATLRWQYAQGQRVWYPNQGEVARYQQMADLLAGKGITQPAVVTKEHLAFHAPEGLTFDGVNLRIVGSFPEQSILSLHEETQAALDEIEALYSDKEQAIVEAVEARDPEIARRWDKAHPLELYREFKKLADPPVEVGLALRTLKAARDRQSAAKEAYDLARVEMANLWVMPAGHGGIEPREYDIGTEAEPMIAIVGPPPWNATKIACPEVKFRELREQGRGDSYEK